MFTKLIAGLVLLAVISGFAWLAVTDAPVHQTTAVEIIPNDRFFNS